MYIICTYLITRSRFPNDMFLDSTSLRFPGDSTLLDSSGSSWRSHVRLPPGNVGDAFSPMLKLRHGQVRLAQTSIESLDKHLAEPMSWLPMSLPMSLQLSDNLDVIMKDHWKRQHEALEHP